MHSETRVSYKENQGTYPGLLDRKQEKWTLGIEFGHIRMKKGESSTKPAVGRSGYGGDSHLFIQSR